MLSPPSGSCQAPPPVRRVGSKDAALRPTESPGSYTVQLTAKPGQSGNALIEIYEADNIADRIQNL